MTSTSEKHPPEETVYVDEPSTGSYTSSPTTDDLYKIFTDSDDISIGAESVYNYLAEHISHHDWTLMNYGFVNKDNDVKKAHVANVDENSAAFYMTLLYSAVIGDTVLQDLDALEVGCGRGGGCVWIERTFKPKSMLGIDYSDTGIKLCQRLHSHIPKLRFEHGNAEHISCSNDSFDVVVNLESSHCYLSMERFLSEVYRVLKPGGYFLWADFRDMGQETVLLKQFQQSGLEMIEQVDITENVVLALDKTREDKLLFLKQFPKELQANFEQWFDNPSIKNGAIFYWRCKFRKPLTPSSGRA